VNKQKKVTGFNHFLNTISTMIKFLLFTIRFRYAKHKANTLHKHTNRQYYVIRWQKKLKVFSAHQLKEMRKQKMITIDWVKLQEVALYKTK